MRITKLLSIGVMSALMLTSCLGDSENKVSGEFYGFKGTLNDDIRSSIRLSSGYRIAYDGDKILDGDFAELSCSITNPNPQAINTADNIVINKVYPEDEQNTVNILSSGEKLGNGDIFLTGLGVVTFSPDNYFGDRWLFSTSRTASKEATDGYLMFFYDKDRQEVPTQLDENGIATDYKAVEKNQVIIDVRVYKESKVGTSIEMPKENSSTKFVSNLQSLRYFIDASNIIDVNVAETQKYVDVYGRNQVAVRFRYIQEKEDRNDKNKKIYVETYLGTFDKENATNSSPFFNLIYTTNLN